MLPSRSTRVLAAITLCGLAAAIWHTAVNYRWQNGAWAPPAVWLVPLAGVLPPLSLFLGVRELCRKDAVDKQRLTAFAFVVLALAAILITLAPLLESV
jgi:hypothetical protein